MQMLIDFLDVPTNDFFDISDYRWLNSSTSSITLEYDKDQPELDRILKEMEIEYEKSVEPYDEYTCFYKYEITIGAMWINLIALHVIRASKRYKQFIDYVVPKASKIEGDQCGLVIFFENQDVRDDTVWLYKELLDYEVMNHEVLGNMLIYVFDDGLAIGGTLAADLKEAMKS